MSIPSANPSAHIHTSHSYFLRASDSPSHPPISLLLRGVNLSSNCKYPNLPTEQHVVEQEQQSDRKGRDEARVSRAGAETHLGDQAGFWSEAEAGGKEGWFAGRPLELDTAELHLKRLKAWGFTTIRLIVTWEGLEHAGPGKYDEAYIDYLISLLQICRAQDMKVFISPHQDVFSRFTGGSGAPLWLLLAFGLNPRRIHQSGSAILHSCWEKEGWGGEEGRAEAQKGKIGDFPDMIWNTNLHRLASRHCFTMFFASEVFAPKCKIDGIPAGQWARDHFNAAYGHLADRLARAGGLLDDCLIGWDSMNEPDEGFVGILDLDEIPQSQSFRKGPSPSPIQGLRLGIGESVSNIAYDDFGSLGHKKVTSVTITPPGGEGVWLTREEARNAQARWGWRWGEEWDFWDVTGTKGCPWAAHGAWNRNEGTIMKADYFTKDGEGNDVDFIERFWRPHYISFISRLRNSHPSCISFINPPIFASPPDLAESVKEGRMALSCHFYDGITLLGKRRHLFNADAVALQRGQKNILGALKLGTASIKNGLRDEFEELKSDSRKTEGMAAEESGRKAYPTIIGELGTPFDMKETKWLGLAKGKVNRKDYREPAKAMDQLLNGCDGHNALSYTLWDYEAYNTHLHGDGWNGEDLSLFSYDDLENDLDLVAQDPPDLKSLINLGSRGIHGWCRPYPLELAGKLNYLTFGFDTTRFEMGIEIVSLDGSRLWQAEREELGDADAPFEESEGSVLIYLPFVHYLAEQPGTSDGKRLVGEPSEEEWIKGQGGGRVELEVEELSEGRLEVVGQWGRWFYPLRKSENREARLVVRKWGV